MDVETFFDRIRQNLIDLMNGELTDLDSARVQTTAWIRFRVEVEDENGNVIGVDRVRLPFNSRMTDIFRGSDLKEIVNQMLAHMKTQIENPTLANSKFTLDEVLFLDVNFYQSNLTRDSSYLLLPDWISRKGAVISPKNENDEECFKWAVTAALHHKEIKSHPKRVSNIRQYVDNYDWHGIEFPVAISKINKFEKNNGISIYLLHLKKIDRKKVIILLLIDDGERRHYTVIKSLSRLLGSSNCKHKYKQHFFLNCLQGFHSEESRDRHLK